MGRERDPKIHLLGTYELIHEHLTKQLCEEVFHQMRDTERQRTWSLYVLAEVWVAIIMDPPPALRHALVRVTGGSEDRLFPQVSANPGSFFERCQTLRPAFFSRLYERFTRALLPKAPVTYRSDLQGLRKRFGDVCVVDGSKLEEVAHRLKITWDNRSVLLPGCLLAIYDLFRGTLRGLRFEADAAKSEFTRAVDWVQEGFPEAGLAPDTLLIGDRLYGGVRFLTELGRKGVWGLVRRTKQVSVKRDRCLRRTRTLGGVVEDWLVDVGSGVTSPVQRFRYLRFQKKKKVLELLTNVLDPKRLTATEALGLYSARWSVERMYFDLKEVLNLNRIYAANVNAVAMQVYASAMVYNALRVAQALAARQAQVHPEEISTKKFFPLLVAIVGTWITKEATFEEIQEANARVRLRKPDWKHDRSTYACLSELQVEERRGKRRKRRYCAARGRWKPLVDLMPKRRELS